MSIVVKTLVKDGLGTEAKMIVADTNDDWKALKSFILFCAFHPMIVVPEELKELIETLKESK